MKAIIFDMDGVMVDSEPYHCKAWIQTYAEHGIVIEEAYYFKKCQGKHGLVSAQIVIDEHKKQGEPETLVFRKEQIASNIIQGNIQGMKNIVNAVKKLSEKYVLGLASSSGFSTVNAVLQTLGIKDYFKVIHAGESVKKGKPHPDVYLKTAKMLGIEPKDCIVIEDSASGVISGKTAGMKVIGFLNGRNNEASLSYADKIITSFDELTPALIEKL